MNETKQRVFKLQVKENALRLALMASLQQLAEHLGEDAKRVLAELEATCVRDVKNLIPKASVPDAVVQAGVEEAIAALVRVFQAVCTKRGLS